MSEKHKNSRKTLDKLKIRKNKFVGEKQDRNNNFLIRLGNLNNFYAK
jgi:hypothetical protein